MSQSDTSVVHRDELEERVRSFTDQAHKVSAWDRQLIANGEQIIALKRQVGDVDAAQNQLKTALDKIKIDEDELESMVCQLERDLEGCVCAHAVVVPDNV